MSEINIDLLLQVSAPRADRSAVNSARGRDEQPAFDDHLYQASATTPVEPARTNEDRRPEAAATASANAADGEAANYDDETADEATAPTESITESAEGDPSNAGDTNTVVPVAATVSSEEIIVDKADHAADSNSDSRESLTKTGADGASSGRSHDSKGSKAESAEVLPNADDSQGAKPVGPDGTPETLCNAHEATVHELPACNDTLLAAGGEALHVEAGTVVAAETRDRQNGSVKRGRLAIDEGEPASELPTQEQAEQTSIEPTEKLPLSGEDKPHTREGAIRSEAQNNPPAANAKHSVIAAAQVAVVESAGEAAKTDSGDEAPRPVGAAASARAEALLPPLAKLQHGNSLVARGQRTADGEEFTRVDSARFVGRVARAFHTAQERGGALQLRLSPPELGAMRLELLVKDGVLTATLETETPAARRVLLDNLPALRDRLAEQNIRIEKFDVDVRRDGSGGQQQPAPQQRDQQSPLWMQQRNHSQPAKNAADAPLVTPVLGAPITDTQINLVA